MQRNRARLLLFLHALTCSGCASSYPHFATYLKDHLGTDCPEDKIRIIAVHDYGEPRVFDLEACGRNFEIEERVKLTQAKGLRPEDTGVPP